MKDKYRFCSRCKKVRLAEHFQQVTRADRLRTLVCGACASDLDKAKTQQGRDELSERDERERLIEARIWSKAMSDKRWRPDATPK